MHDSRGRKRQGEQTHENNKIWRFHRKFRCVPILTKEARNEQRRTYSPVPIITIGIVGAAAPPSFSRWPDRPKSLVVQHSTNAILFPVRSTHIRPGRIAPAGGTVMLPLEIRASALLRAALNIAAGLRLRQVWVSSGARQASYWLSLIANCRSGCVISPHSFCRSACSAWLSGSFRSASANQRYAVGRSRGAHNPAE